MSAAGTDIGGTSDQFVFTSRTVSGDVDLIARVGSLTATNAWAKAGVMIRGSLAANAPHVFAAVSPASGAIMQHRSTTGGSTTDTVSSGGGAPMWVKIERRGSTFRTYRSTDGLSWQQIGSVSMTLPQNAYVGIAVTSRNASTRTSAQVGGVVAMPAGWSGADIGGTMLGNIWQSYSTFSGFSAGTGLGSTSDQVRYVYQQFTGDVEITSALSFLETLGLGSQAGIMIRASMSPNSQHASIMSGTLGSLTFLRRRNAGATAVSSTLAALALPARMRLQKRGNTINAYVSRDGGASWQLSGTDTIELGSSFYVGVAGASSVLGASAAIWNNTEVTGVPVSTPPPNQAPAVSLTAPASGATYPAPASIALSASATDNDGTIQRVEFRNGSTVLGTDSSSPYSFTWSNVPAGTYSLTAVAVDNDGASTTSGAVTVTVTSPNQAPTVSFTSPSSGALYPAPASITLNASAGDSDGTIQRVEFRNGSTVLGTDSSSPYSFTWSNVSAGTYSLTAVAFDNAGASTTSSAVTVTVAAPSNQAPTVALTSPASGASYTAPASIALSATAADIDGTIARVEFRSNGAVIGTDTSSPYAFTWSSVAAGTYTLTAVAVDNAGASSTSGAVTVTVGVSGNRAPGAYLSSPSNNARYNAPASITMGATAWDEDGTVARVEFRAGSTVLTSDSTRPFSYTWSNVAAGTYSLTAVAVDNHGATGPSQVVTVTVTGTSSNQSPVVSLTSPTQGASFSAPASISLTASASDSDGTIARVEFYSGSTLIATDTSSPYAATWSGVPAGTYSLMAVAYDNAGAMTSSAQRSISVVAGSTTTRAVFAPSSDHESVTQYVLDIFYAGSNPNTSNPLATRDLGKPAIVNGECSVDVSQFLQSLPAGSYIATVAAISPSGSARSSATSFTRP